MRKLIQIASFALSLLAFNHASAHTIDVSVGGSATVGLRLAEVGFLDYVGDTHENAVTWQPTLTLGFVGSRSDRRDHLDHDVFVAGGGARLVWWRHAFFGAEIGYVSQRTDALSSHEQFISSLGWQGERYVVMLRHISNADLFGGRNLGETMVLAGLSF